MQIQLSRQYLHMLLCLCYLTLPLIFFLRGYVACGMVNSDSGSDTSVPWNFGDANTILGILRHEDRSRIERKSTLFLNRLFPDHTPTNVEVVGDEMQRSPREVSMEIIKVGPSFLLSLPFFGERKATECTAGGDKDLLKRMESEYIKAVDRELPRTILVCPEVGSYPLHMHREYATPLWVDGGDNEGMSSNINTPLLKRKPTIVSHDVLMVVFSFLPARLPALISVGHVCRAWRTSTPCSWATTRGTASRSSPTPPRTGLRLLPHLHPPNCPR